MTEQSDQPEYEAVINARQWLRRNIDSMTHEKAATLLLEGIFLQLVELNQRMKREFGDPMKVKP